MNVEITAAIIGALCSLFLMLYCRKRMLEGSESAFWFFWAQFVVTLSNVSHVFIGPDEAPTKWFGWLYYLLMAATVYTYLFPSKNKRPPRG